MQKYPTIEVERGMCKDLLFKVPTDMDLTSSKLHFVIVDTNNQPIFEAEIATPGVSKLTLPKTLTSTMLNSRYLYNVHHDLDEGCSYALKHDGSIIMVDVAKGEND